MKTSTYCIVLVAYVTCMIRFAESCQQCGPFGRICCKDNDETCTYDGICRSNRENDCGGHRRFYCLKPTTCCGLLHCCPENSTCCGHLHCCPEGSTCCGSGNLCCDDAKSYCSDEYTCKAHSTATTTTYGLVFLLFIFIPVIAICACVCRCIRIRRQNAAAHQTTPRRARNNGDSGYRIFMAYSINSSSVATISDRTQDPHTNAAFAGPPSYEEISHASPVDGTDVYANDAAKMPEPPSYNDVISGNAAGLNTSGGQSGNCGGESSDSGAASDNTNTSSSETGGVDNMSYV